MTGRAKALMWGGIGLCAAGAVGLLVGGVLDVQAADPWASVAGGAAGLVGLALTVYALFTGTSGATEAPGGTTVTASGARSVAAGGNIGSVSTGNAPATPPASPSPASPPATPPAPRNVTASGERSIAAGGDIGSASTGDA
ncbi:hypothetical protein ACF1AX_20925 [Streptomyces sp. NPDC014802]|uniref:hypothetical protein n=1 Tax=Streptomyces sp. NPDC014802 TaxID=3364917 RepID=UPI00370265E8